MGQVITREEEDGEKKRPDRCKGSRLRERETRQIQEKERRRVRERGGVCERERRSDKCDSDMRETDRQTYKQTRVTWTEKELRNSVWLTNIVLLLSVCVHVLPWFPPSPPWSALWLRFGRFGVG